MKKGKFKTVNPFLVFMALIKHAFENIVGKGENAGNRHFLHLPQCFLPFPKQISIFWIRLFCRLQNALNWDRTKILPFGKGLKVLVKLGFKICLNLQLNMVNSHGNIAKKVEIDHPALYQMTKFWKIYSQRFRPAFSHFPTMSSNDLFLEVVTIQDCVVLG